MAHAKEIDRVRLSLDITPRVREQLTHLEAKTEAGSITEVVRRALALYDLIMEHQDEGGKLIFKHMDGDEETLRVL
jgi:hypothetical protein